MRLNKYLAHAGVASRRESDRLIQEGMVSVNNQLVLDPAYDVKDSDEIMYDGKYLSIQDEIIWSKRHLESMKMVAFQNKRMARCC